MKFCLLRHPSFEKDKNMKSENKFEKLYCEKSKKFNDLKKENKELHEQAEYYKNLNDEILETSEKMFALNEALSHLNKEYSDLIDRILKRMKRWNRIDLIMTPLGMAIMFACGYFLGK